MEEIFNALLKSIRDKKKVQTEILDCYLTNIADQQKIVTMVTATCDQITWAPSDSLVAQIRLPRPEASLSRNPLVY